jgi:ribosomal protein L37AE/L43A
VANTRNFIDNEPVSTTGAYQRPPCPKCRSLDTGSAAKNPTANSYWRCQKCGDVFSPALLSDASRRGWR